MPSVVRTRLQERMVPRRFRALLIACIVGAAVASLVAYASGAAAPINHAVWTKIATTGTGPVPACDHVAAVMNGQLYIYGGGDDSNDYWVNDNIYGLDLSTKPLPTWRIVPYTNPVKPLYRTAHWMELDAPRNRLIVYAGYSPLVCCVGSISFSYNDDLWVFQFTGPEGATGSWNAIQNKSSTGISNPNSPPGRAWHAMSWIRDPNAPTAPSQLVLYGGMGTSNALLETLAETDKGDTYILNTNDWTWTFVGNTTCQSSSVSCTDSQIIAPPASAMDTLLTQVTTLARSATRPAALQSALADLQSKLSQLANTDVPAAITAWNTSTLNHTNNDATCSTVCLEAGSVANQPRRTEGHRMWTYQNIVYVFGGYSCSKAGQQADGGPPCYDNTLYRFDTVTRHWLSPMYEPKPTDDQYPLWPPRRAFHIAVLVGRKVYVHGGGYKDVSGVLGFYSDVRVLNMETMLWEAVSILGSGPAAFWSHTANFLPPDRLIIQGGCDEAQSYDGVYTLTLGLTFSASNANVTGIRSTVKAGVPMSFLIRAIENLNNQSDSLASGDIVWGEPLIWATGLQFDVRAIGSLADGSVGVSIGVVKELGGGVYNATVTPTVGVVSMIHVYYNDVLAPGAPFPVSLIPGVAGSRTSRGSGSGLVAGVRGEVATFTVALHDVYGNPSKVGGDADRITIAVNGNAAAEIGTPIDNGDGTYTLQYTVPDVERYSVAVMLSGTEIGGSPFAVLSYEPVEITPSAIVAIGIIATLFGVIIVVYMVCVIRHRDQRVMKSSSPLFMILICLGGLLLLASVATLPSPTDAGCQAFPFVSGIGYTLAISSIVVKTWRLIKIFAPLKLAMVDLPNAKLLGAVGAVLLIELLYQSLWVGINPSKAVRTKSTSNEYLTFADCHIDPIWNGIQLAYKALGLVYAVFLITIARELPKGFNESKYIGVAVYSAVLTALFGGLGLFLSPNDQVTTIFLIKSFMIIWNTGFTVSVLMLPRVYYLFYPPPDDFFKQRPSTHEPSVSRSLSQFASAQTNSGAGKSSGIAIAMVSLNRNGAGPSQNSAPNSKGDDDGTGPSSLGSGRKPAISSSPAMPQSYASDPSALNRGTTTSVGAAGNAGLAVTSGSISRANQNSNTDQTTAPAATTAAPDAMTVTVDAPLGSSPVGVPPPVGPRSFAPASFGGGPGLSDGVWDGTSRQASHNFDPYARTASANVTALSTSPGTGSISMIAGGSNAAAPPVGSLRQERTASVAPPPPPAEEDE